MIVESYNTHFIVQALSFIFIDVNSGERRLHADGCYRAFHNRTVALFAWTDMVHMLVNFRQVSVHCLIIYSNNIIIYWNYPIPQTVKQVIEPEVNRVKKELSRVAKQVRDVRFRSIQKQVR